MTGRIAVAFAAAALAAGCATSRAVPESPVVRAPVLIAHVGMAQRYDLEGVGRDTCTASRIRPPVHDYLDNTIRAIGAAFDAGADIVELDVHPTTDGEFAVFHDWTLDCRTDGRGVTRERTMAELRALDVGWGYTADGGRTFPFRGRGQGLMPTLAEVIDRFPGKGLLVNVKSDDPAEGEALARYLGRWPASRLADIAVYGGHRPVSALRERLPAVRVTSRKLIEDCAVTWLLAGWTGRVPSACEGLLLLVPVNYASWLWGWPHEAERRLRAAGTLLVVAGPSWPGQPIAGLDTPEALSALPRGFTGGIWTDDIERAARVFGRR